MPRPARRRSSATASRQSSAERRPEDLVDLPERDHININNEEQDSARARDRHHPYRDVAWNMDNPGNWTVAELKDRLWEDCGIKVPRGSISKATLKSWYIENRGSTFSSRTNTTQATLATPAAPNTVTTDTHTNTPGSSSGSDTNNMAALLSTLNNVTQCFSSLQETVKQLTAEKGEKRPNFNLGNWYVSNRAETTVPLQDLQAFGPQTTASSPGIRSDSITAVDIVSPSLQRQITEGKDINLASLLIPNYDCPQNHTVVTDNIEFNLMSKPDPRMNRQLTIQEFIKAFGKYKRVMCNTYPERQQELDAYQDDIIEISNFYHTKFYDYHKMFSAKAAAILREKHIKVDWSKRDRDLLALVSAGVEVKACQSCNMVDHTTQFCPLKSFHERSNSGQVSDKTQNNKEKVDRQGRHRNFFEGHEICNNFNGSQGCFRNQCPLLHICARCKNQGHGAILCPRKKTNTTVNSSSNHRGKLNSEK